MFDPMELIRAQTSAAPGVEIRMWSFGAVSALRPPVAAGWQSLRHTLEDEAVFGPRTDYHCVCGKYGSDHFGPATVCDICGVKVGPKSLRATRFGHIQLPLSIRHEISDPSARIDCFPILPARIRESKGAEGLDDMYEELLSACASGSETPIITSYHKICEKLTPITATALQWSLPDAELLAKGMGLTMGPRDDDQETST